MANQPVSEMTEINPRAVPGDNKPPPVHELLAIELAETYRLELERAAPIAARANDAPEKIESDDDLKHWTGIYLDADALLKSLDGARLNEQRPLLAVLKTVFAPTLERLTRITEHGRKISNDYNREKLRREKAERDAEERRLRAEAEARQNDAQIAAEFGDTKAVVEHAQAAASTEAEAAVLAADAPKAADVARVRTDDGAGMSTAKTEWLFAIEDYSKVDLNAIRPFLDPKDIDKAVRKAVKIQKGATRIEGVRVFEDVATQFRR